MGCTEQLLLTAAVMSLLDAIRMQAGQGKAIPKLTNILKSDMPDDVLVHVLKTLVNLSLCCMWYIRVIPNDTPEHMAAVVSSQLLPYMNQSSLERAALNDIRSQRTAPAWKRDMLVPCGVDFSTQHSRCHCIRVGAACSGNLGQDW
jgi:hypothetical protein